MKKLLLILFLGSISIFAQGGWQEEPTVSTIENIFVGAGYYYSPREPLYIRLGQEKFCFYTGGTVFFSKQKFGMMEVTG